LGIEAAAVPLDQSFEQRAGAGRLSAVAQRDGFEDRVGSVGNLAAGEQLLELELRAWARGDHLDQADLVALSSPRWRTGIANTRSRGRLPKRTASS
jgi:hypothetical protein